MQVALIADTAWLAEEMATFRHLAVGLTDEQVRVAQLVPASIDEQDLNPFGDWLRWHDSRWRWLRRWRLHHQHVSMHDMSIDVIHALDGRLWEGAMHLAHRLNTNLVLSSTSASDVRFLRRLATRLDRTRAAIAAGTQPLCDLIRQIVADRAEVHLVRPGVHITMDDEATRPNSSALCGVISGTGRFDADYECLFYALRRIVADQPDAQFFLDGTSGNAHPLWNAARRFGLLANVSLVPATPGHRGSMRGADMLIHPQALHRARGLTLQAMAHGLPVLARADPWVDYLIEDRTAWMVEVQDPEAWYRLIRGVGNDPDRSRRLGASARQWVRDHHLASAQVAATIEVYRGLTAETLKFSHDGTTDN